MSYFTNTNWSEFCFHLPIVFHSAISGQEGLRLLTKNNPEKFHGSLMFLSALAGITAVAMSFFSWIRSKNQNPSIYFLATKICSQFSPALFFAMKIINSFPMEKLRNSFLVISNVTKLVSDSLRILTKIKCSPKTLQKVIKFSLQLFLANQILFNYKISSKKFRDHAFYTLLVVDGIALLLMEKEVRKKVRNFFKFLRTF